MKLKNRLKYGICEMGHVPWVARIAGVPKLRRVLGRVPLVRAIYDTGWARLHPFDRLHGIETSVADDPNEPQLADQSAFPYAHFYAGSQPGLIRTALAMVPNVVTSTFIDLGCGKGRPLFVATEFPFRDIVGIEFSPHLAGVARTNAAKMSKRYPERTRVRIKIGDAGAYTFPDGDIVLFLYNPFDEPIILKVAAALETALATAPRSIYIIYYNPVFGYCFDALSSLKRLFTRTLPHDQGELGFGLGGEDTLTLWRGGNAPNLPG